MLVWAPLTASTPAVVLALVFGRKTTGWLSSPALLAAQGWGADAQCRGQLAACHLRVKTWCWHLQARAFLKALWLWGPGSALPTCLRSAEASVLAGALSAGQTRSDSGSECGAFFLRKGALDCSCKMELGREGTRLGGPSDMGSVVHRLASAERQRGLQA